MLVAIDFETYLISEQSPIPKPVCLSFYQQDKQYGLLIGDDMRAFLFRLLSGTDKIIAHNLSFEALVIDHHFPEMRPLLRQKFDRDEMICTKVHEQLIDNTRKKQIKKYSLADLVQHYFKKDISEDKKDPNSWRLRYSELDGVPLSEWPQKARSYAIEDSIWAYEIYLKQMSNHQSLKISVSADYYLNKMGMYGITICQERVTLLKKEIESKLHPDYAYLIEQGFVEKVKGKYTKKVKAIKEYITESVQGVKYTAKGSISVTNESISEYLKEFPEGNATLETYLRISEYEKVLTAFISRLEVANPLIRTNYKAVVSSGRTSSSTSMHFPSVNIQQMPRQVSGVTWDVRNCFVSRPGYKIVSIDYSGLELASTANQLKELTSLDNMASLINSGSEPIDMHSMLAYRIMNIKEKTQETYESFVSKKKEKPYKDYRQLAKPINLGFPGGIGYDTMRTLLARDKIYPKIQVLETSQYENNLSWKARAARKEGYPVRIRRVGKFKYELIYDDLVLLKKEMFNLYPDLDNFLSNAHAQYLTGEVKKIKNEFGEWETEEMYSYDAHEFKRDWCQYTQICNGLLMQSPSAIGAKKAMIQIISKYADSNEMHPLAFIHDEIVFEVTPEASKEIIKDVSDIMITCMQSVLKHVRIAVEAEICGTYWRKSGGEWQIAYWKNPGESCLYSK